MPACLEVLDGEDDVAVRMSNGGSIGAGNSMTDLSAMAGCHDVTRSGTQTSDGVRSDDPRRLTITKTWMPAAQVQVT